MFDQNFLWNQSFFHYEKIMRFKKVLSFLELEGQGHGIIMGVTRLLLLGLFYTIQMQFYVLFCTRLYLAYCQFHCITLYFGKSEENLDLSFIYVAVSLLSLINRCVGPWLDLHMIFQNISILPFSWFLCKHIKNSTLPISYYNQQRGIAFYFVVIITSFANSNC